MTLTVQVTLNEPLASKSLANLLFVTLSLLAILLFVFVQSSFFKMSLLTMAEDNWFVVLLT